MTCQNTMTRFTIRVGQHSDGKRSWRKFFRRPLRRLREAHDIRTCGTGGGSGGCCRFETFGRRGCCDFGCGGGDGGWVAVTRLAAECTAYLSGLRQKSTVVVSSPGRPMRRRRRRRRWPVIKSIAAAAAGGKRYSPLRSPTGWMAALDSSPTSTDDDSTNLRHGMALLHTPGPRHQSLMFR